MLYFFWLCHSFTSTAVVSRSHNSDFLSAQTRQTSELDPGLNTLFDHDNNVEYEQLAAVYWEFDPFSSVPDVNKTTHSLTTPLPMSPVPNTSLDDQLPINSLGLTSSGTAPLPVFEDSCSSPTEAQDAQSSIGTERDVPKRPISYHCSTCPKTFSHRHKLQYVQFYRFVWYKLLKLTSAFQQA